MSRTVTKQFTETKGRCGQRRLVTEDTRPEVPFGRLPRITKLMALAIRFETLLQEGVVKDQAEIARLGMISRARVTQIMNLLNLAPEIQEELLFLPRVERGRDPVTLKQMLPVAGEVCWKRQKRIWKRFHVGNLNLQSIIQDSV